MTTPLQIAAFYVALNALIALILAFNVGRVRGVTKTVFGDGGHQSLQQAIRAHSNNIEYVPIALVMLVTLALLQASVILLHVLGVALTLGRIAHGIGLTRSSGASVGRAAGTLLTFAVFIAAIVVLLMKAFVF
jgi:uncharacterized protein